MLDVVSIAILLISHLSIDYLKLEAYINIPSKLVTLLTSHPSID
jgi:hypothetical protein